MLMAVATKLRVPGRRPTSREMISEGRVGLGAALALIALVSLIQLLDAAQGRHIGVLAAAPMLAAALASWRQALAVGVVATGMGALFSVPDAANPRLMLSNFVSVALIVFGTGIAAVVGLYRQRQAERFIELSKLASVAQSAVLRPLGPQLGQLSIAARYISASAAADIGGDLYEALDTPYGVRMIIGDVRGKGLDAVRLASIVLGSYRHIAYERADLRAIVADLDRAVARSVGDEDFVTAALVEERGGTLTIVNCGHPPPMLLRRGEVIELTPPVSAPPLGFMPVVRPRVERLEPGDRLLFYTDGLAEARRDGEFFPTAGRAWRLLGHGTVADGLASLESALIEWVRGQLDDDIALVLMEYAGAHGPADPLPRWEIGGASSPALT
ncbi:serine/threonine-protein phosphatase [Planosporangium flavigriseum]|uniref:Membrane protein n=1 Tax=Planosporangium flavigriseum TaxID=373681 RepID=A0A8J3PKP6_9ACTN|nr:serine/threonine-protein phosphatase [Planosporangium flavigriseum]GIG72123.1 membrane protein [Planosporangium flavigriseum]